MSTHHSTVRDEPLELALAALRCTRCKRSDFAVEPNALRCRGCDQRMRIEGRVIDAMPNPSKEVVAELRGMMREASYEGELRPFMIRKVDKVSTHEERKAISRDEVFDYYGSTELNFEQVMERLHITGRERVLEIGAHDDYPFLARFRDRGCTCFETNIYFVYDDESTRTGWPVRVLGDMHDLPYKDEEFDVVLMSAASHHATDLPAMAKEIARVTKPGGVFVNINEPIRGAIKHILSKKKIEKGHQSVESRDELIHEHEYSVLEYIKAFRAAGFSLEASLFSRYYDERLSTARVRGVRFDKLAGLVSRAWKLPLVRKLAMGPGLWVAQVTIGLQMNAIYRKRA